MALDEGDLGMLAIKPRQTGDGLERVHSRQAAVAPEAGQQRLSPPQFSKFAGL